MEADDRRRRFFRDPAERGSEIRSDGGQRSARKTSNVPEKDIEIRIKPYRAEYELNLLAGDGLWNEEKQEEIVFLTNHLEFGATTIAAIYKRGAGKIELFFKSLKQLLRVKTFVGTSANAL